ncbi:hypothetical protein [Variovorax sp. GB1P17]|uniref:hypothetical protein n=1 Tax=Variovorax sp. GB1P17 TaxID=3443740 RepID=UPI003F44BB78
MASVVDLRYKKLSLAISKARSELANSRTAQSAEIHRANVRQHLAEALALVDTLLKEHRAKKG